MLLHSFKIVSQKHVLNSRRIFPPQTHKHARISVAYFYGTIIYKRSSTTKLVQFFIRLVYCQCTSVVKKQMRASWHYGNIVSF